MFLSHILISLLFLCHCKIRFIVLLIFSIASATFLNQFLGSWKRTVLIWLFLSCGLIFSVHCVCAEQMTSLQPFCCSDHALFYLCVNIAFILGRVNLFMRQSHKSKSAFFGVLYVFQFYPAATLQDAETSITICCMHNFEITTSVREAEKSRIGIR